MANKRTLKKSIHLICEELFAEGVATALYGPQAGKTNSDETLYAILKMQDHYIRRVSHPEPGIPAKAYYRDLWEKFQQEANECIDRINA